MIPCQGASLGGNAEDCWLFGDSTGLQIAEHRVGLRFAGRVRVPCTDSWTLTGYYLGFTDLPPSRVFGGGVGCRWCDKR